MAEIDYEKIGAITIDPIDMKIIARTKQGFPMWERKYECYEKLQKDFRIINHNWLRTTDK